MRAHSIAFCNAQRSDWGVDNVRFAQGLLPDLDIAGLEGADLMISSSVVEYVASLDKCVELFARLLKPGGALVLSMPNVLSISRNLERLAYKERGGVKSIATSDIFPRHACLQLQTRRDGVVLQESYYYAHTARLAKAVHEWRLPATLTADFVRRGLPQGVMGSARCGAQVRPKLLHRRGQRDPLWQRC